jgi:alkylated DNA repair dioxygenase AlkB
MSLKKTTLPKDLNVELLKAFYKTSEADKLFLSLLKKENITYESRDIKLFGKVYKQPRLISWHGDPKATYTYSGELFKPKAWTKSLNKIRKDLQEHLGVDFNSVLLNLYRDGSDSMGLHSDDEKELGDRPIIASVSFGETRRLRFVHKKTKESYNFELAHGDLLLMKGQTQELFKHELPKSKKYLKPRLNLTFRKILL